MLFEKAFWALSGDALRTEEAAELRVTSWSCLCCCFCDLLIGQFCYDESYTWVVKWVWGVFKANRLCVRSGIAKRFPFDCQFQYCADKGFEAYFWLSERGFIYGGLGERSGSKSFCPLGLTPSTARGGSGGKAKVSAFSPDAQNWAALSLSHLALSPGAPLVPPNGDISGLIPQAQ